MAKEYTITTTHQTALPRSERLRALGVGAVSATETSASSGTADHTHENLSTLNKLSEDSGYLYIQTTDEETEEVTAEKVLAGAADTFVNNTVDTAQTFTEGLNVGSIAVTPDTSITALRVGGPLLTEGGVTMYYTSDFRLKRDIAPALGALEVLRSLGTVCTFKYVDSEVQRDLTLDGRHTGLLYQYVAESKLPQIANIRPDGYGTVNYIHPDLIATLIAAVGELRERVEELEKQLNG